jgi:hypothetical protein
VRGDGHLIFSWRNQEWLFSLLLKYGSKWPKKPTMAQFRVSIHMRQQFYNIRPFIPVTVTIKFVKGFPFAIKPLEEKLRCGHVLWRWAKKNYRWTIEAVETKTIGYLKLSTKIKPMLYRNGYGCFFWRVKQTIKWLNYRRMWFYQYWHHLPKLIFPNFVKILEHGRYIFTKRSGVYVKITEVWQAWNQPAGFKHFTKSRLRNLNIDTLW